MKRLFAAPLIGIFCFALFNVLSTTSCSFTNTTESITDSTSSTFNWYHPGMLQKERKIQFFRQGELFTIERRYGCRER